MKLAIRTCNQDGSSYGGFKWSLEVGAKVSAPDWDPNPGCGGGLHGLLWGTGDVSLLNHLEPDKIWMVVEVEEYVDLEGKIKFPECTIRYIGDRDGAVEMIQKNAPSEFLVHFARKTVGDDQTVTVGNRGTATAGENGTAIAGNFGVATAGSHGTATAGRFGTATAGHRGVTTAGDSGTATAGDGGKATAGDSGTATAGDFGAASAGYRGVATAGRLGTATAGRLGTATAGGGGQILIDYFNCRLRTLIGYIGEDGLKPNTPYRVKYGKFVEA